MPSYMNIPLNITWYVTLIELFHTSINSAQVMSHKKSEKFIRKVVKNGRNSYYINIPREQFALSSLPKGLSVTSTFVNAPPPPKATDGHSKSS